MKHSFAATAAAVALAATVAIAPAASAQGSSGSTGSDVSGPVAGSFDSRSTIGEPTLEKLGLGSAQGSVSGIQKAINPQGAVLANDQLAVVLGFLGSVALGAAPVALMQGETLVIPAELLSALGLKN